MAKTFTGTVSSSTADKTIIVKIERRKTHPLYRKQYKETVKFMAHDEKNEAMVGDKVSIIECRPISKNKHFKLEKVLETPKLREDALQALKTDETPTEAKEDKS